jgi:hypothetical protein
LLHQVGLFESAPTEAFLATAEALRDSYSFGYVTDGTHS